MIRKGCEWLAISAEGQPWGATINTRHINHVRVQPGLTSEGELVEGLFQVVVSTTEGDQVLAFKDKETALGEYFKLSNELRGVLAD